MTANKHWVPEITYEEADNEQGQLGQLPLIHVPSEQQMPPFLMIWEVRDSGETEPGPDGGVDILAGAGPMGFDNPRICVQVKSSSSPADVTVFRSLQGSVQTFNAEQGLLVCWGGFNRKVIEEARRSFFTIRLWDSGDLLEAIIKNYDRFPDALQAELPLKRIWSLVVEEQ